ncbi:hypothetical protein SLEP1_g32944 [Rubroshorea leprosula]|uniref:Uncharacterized protein n=1 Tax=Rubroshorea leprosula TaxID=152421 RepID=A0AAV5KF21_9ROSI|nr:hypothetical protein SLEP1_g32944 [Rubroshorea leprosula]
MTAIPQPAASPAGFGVGQGQQTVLQQNSTRLVNLARLLTYLMQPQGDARPTPISSSSSSSP